MIMAHSVCPWWLGYLLASPIRKLLQDPDGILRPYVKPGMVALDVGSAMGFFTLPMARLVGSTGHVIAVDLQEKMINSLRRRATKAGLTPWMEFRVCESRSLGVDDLAGKVDFALTFAVLHEMPEVESAFKSIALALRTGGILLVAEPTGHVTEDAFKTTLAAAERCGLKVTERPVIKRSLTAVLQKTA
jgi:ubiquinone/menaquinone biosynthesis C-methylase UbiE